MNDFKWTDELVKKFVAEKIILGNCKSAKEALEQFKEEYTKPKVEWEVESVVDYRIGKIYKHEYWENNHGFNGNSYGYVLQAKIPHRYHIHSVKRLSDQEVFSIGDEVEWSFCEGGHKINRFYQQIEGGMLYVDGHEPCKFNFPFLGIKKATKPIPLFKSLDGKDLFIGDDVFIVVTFDNIHQHTLKESDRGMWKDAKMFSTKEAAEGYAIMNRPHFSINDLKNIIGKRDWIGRDFFIELAKEKLSK
jgi:hypothetical protein